MTEGLDSGENNFWETFPEEGKYIFLKAGEGVLQGGNPNFGYFTR